MAGYRGLGSAFQQRRKKHGSSRRWAIKNKQPLTTSVTPTAPVPNDKTKLETSVQDTKQLSSTLSIVSVFFAVGSIVQKFRNTINNTCSGFLNVFLFWRGYAERVESLHLKVQELQLEIVQLHSTFKLSQEAKTPGDNYRMPDAVPCSIPPPPPPPVSLPPSPPPPPPPPLPTTFAAPTVALIPSRTVKPPSLKEKHDGHVAVTLQDLQTVRLRKVTVTNKRQISPEIRTPLVTLADLQKVRLRRSHSDLSVKCRSSLGRTPTKSSQNLRVQLRKVHMSRSPGGTPLCNKENKVMDSSFDISMTKALGNKQLNVLTARLSPLKSV